MAKGNAIVKRTKVYAPDTNIPTVEVVEKLEIVSEPVSAVHTDIIEVIKEKVELDTVKAELEELEAEEKKPKKAKKVKAEKVEVEEPKE